MRKLIKAIVLSVVLTLGVASSANSNEKKVLESLVAMKSLTSGWTSYGKYSELLSQAKTEFQTLKGHSKNTLFLGSAERALDCYVKAEKLWKRRNDMANKFLAADPDSASVKMMILNNEEVIKGKWKECAPLVDAVQAQ
jgi:hypothetical protein